MSRETPTSRTAGRRPFLAATTSGWDDLLMDQHDPEKRIAELERQLAEQKRIAELERQLAEAKGAAREAHVVEQPAQFSDAEPGAGQAAVDEHALGYAQALSEGLRTGGPS